MSTSKHFDKMCIGVVAVMLVISILFMNGASIGISAASRSFDYESRLFDTSLVHSIAIVMDDWDTFIENCESEEYSSCTAVIDGEKYKNIGIRAKGNTSLSSVKSLGSQRYSFKIEFDHYEKGKSYYGLDKLCLNNLIQDNTMMKDYLVYQLMNEFGVESPLYSFVYITVNGEDWGLYLAVEGIEDAFLERNYGSSTGELYKPDSMSFGGGRGNGKDFNMDDFDGSDHENTDNNGSSQKGRETAPQMPDGNNSMPGGNNNTQPNGSRPQMQGDTNGTPPQMPGNTNGTPPQMPNGNMSQTMGSDDVKLKYIDDDPDSYSNIFDNAKTDISDADKEKLIYALKNLSEYNNIEDVVNTEEVIRYFVVHNFVCNGDSYTGNMIHNYYLHEKQGQLSMIPWDYNLAFGTFQGNQASSTINTSIDSPVSGGTADDRPMLGWIFSDEKYTQQYHDAFSEFIEKYFSNNELAATIDETAELIRPYVEKDPTKFCTTDEFEKGVEALSSFVTLRAQAVSRQLDGDTAQVDTGDLNLSDMGTMNAGMENRKNQGAGFDVSSMITVTDKNGDSVDISSLIGDVSSIVSVTLSDGTIINVSGADPQSMKQVDFTQIVSVTDKSGKVTDLSEYTISVSIPSMKQGNGESSPESDFQNKGNPPAGENQFKMDGNRKDNFNGMNAGSSTKAWIYISISVLVLGLGLLIAFKKKY